MFSIRISNCNQNVVPVECSEANEWPLSFFLSSCILHAFNRSCILSFMSHIISFFFKVNYWVYLLFNIRWLVSAPFPDEIVSHFSQSPNSSPRNTKHWWKHLQKKDASDVQQTQVSRQSSQRATLGFLWTFFHCSVVNCTLLTRVANLSCHGVAFINSLQLQHERVPKMCFVLTRASVAKVFWCVSVTIIINICRFLLQYIILTNPPARGKYKYRWDLFAPNQGQNVPPTQYKKRFWNTFES